MSVTGLLITNGGAAAITADLTGGADLVLSHVAWGDSGGVPYDPVVTQAALVNERYRATIAAVAVIDSAIVVDAILPADTNDATGRPSHSFTVAECGLFSAVGTLIGIARMGDGFKPGPATGQAVIATYRLKLAVANPSAITVVVDPQAQIALGRNVRAGWMTVDGVLNDPPIGPAVGATYVIGAAPTGAWTGFAGRLAQWVGVWSLATVPVGHVVSDNSAAMNAAARYLRWTGAAWVSAAAATDAYGVTRLATTIEAANHSNAVNPLTPATLIAALEARQFTIISQPGSTTITVPEGYTSALVMGWGAGGSSAASWGGSTYTSGAGGGAYAEKEVTGLVAGQVIACTVGAGGLPTTPGAPGLTGGSTSFGAWLTIGGGAGASADPNLGVGGGTASGADFSIPGEQGTGALSNKAGDGGSAPRGGTRAPGGAGSVSPGNAPGGGASGAAPGVAGAAGAPGALIVIWGGR